jgi:hypothetical protein
MPDKRAKSSVNVANAWRNTIILLLAIYVISLTLHVALLWRPSAFPFFASDAVQYAMTGENLRLGKGYTIRGYFNKSLPPVYPAFVALAHSISVEPRVPMLVLSSAIMSLALFPIYKLVRFVGLQRREAIILGAAASVLPHTFYAAIYMAEAIQYPLFLTAFYLAFAWLTNHDPLRAKLLGLTMALMLLTKWQAAQFLLPFFAVACAAYSAARREPPRAAALARPDLCHGRYRRRPSLLWLGYKAAHSGSALGLYGRGCPRDCRNGRGALPPPMPPISCLRPD